MVGMVLPLIASSLQVTTKPFISVSFLSSLTTGNSIPQVKSYGIGVRETMGVELTSTSVFPMLVGGRSLVFATSNNPVPVEI